MTIVEAVGLSKSYENIKAVDGIDLRIEENEILGLLGPNGAGKSTLISLLLGVLNADSGVVKYKGEALTMINQSKYKKSIGYVPQDLAFFPELTALDNVTFWGKLYGLKGAELKSAVQKALQFTGLSERQKESPSKFSGGMKRRLNIACGIVHSPEILFLDEPTVGVDPQSRNHILESIRELNERGTTIVYTSHYIEEVEAICDWVMIMDHGHVITSGTVNELINEISDNRLMNISVENVELAEKLLSQLPDVSNVSVKDNVLNVTMKSSTATASIISVLVEKCIEILSVDMPKQNLEDVFFYYTGSHFRD